MIRSVKMEYMRGLSSLIKLCCRRRGLTSLHLFPFLRSIEQVAWLPDTAPQRPTVPSGCLRSRRLRRRWTRFCAYVAFRFGDVARGTDPALPCRTNSTTSTGTSLTSTMRGSVSRSTTCRDGRRTLRSVTSIMSDSWIRSEDSPRAKSSLATAKPQGKWPNRTRRRAISCPTTSTCSGSVRPSSPSIP